MMNQLFYYLFSTLIVLGTVCPALAHEMRPAYLQIQQLDETTYEVLWKIPRRGDMVIRLQP